MRRNLTKFIILTIHFSISGQLFSYGQINNWTNSVGIKANGGLSYFPTKIHQTGTPQTTQIFYFVPSAQCGIYYNYQVEQKSLFGIELLLTQIEGKEHDETPATDNFGNPTGQFITNDISRHLSYLSVPIYYGFFIKKLNVNFGLQTSMLLKSSGLSKAKSPDNNGGYYNFELKLDNLPVKDFDFGAKLGLSYALTNRFSIEATYYYGLLNIYKYNSADFKYKIQQITIGLRFSFIRQFSIT